MEDISWFQDNGRLLLKMALIGVVTAVLVVLVRRAGDRMLKRLNQRPGFDPTTFRFVHHSLIAVLVVVSFSLIVFMIPGLRHVAATLMASAGILAVIVGFASQAALSNIVSGIFIVIFKPYRINDLITVRDTLTGTVEDISLRHTVIRNFENRRIVIPNSVISNEVVVNANIVEEKICKWIEFGISYDSDIDLARKIVQEECMAHPNFLDVRSQEDIEKDLPAVPVRVLRFGQSSIDMRAWVWAETQGNAFILGCEVLESIKKRFDKEGVEIPFQYHNVIIKNNQK